MAFFFGSAVIAAFVHQWMTAGLHPETSSFFHIYFSPKLSFFQKIFSSDNLEVGQYQARELSYLFDWFDSHFILFCTRAGYPHFASLVYPVAVFLVFVLFYRGSKRRWPWVADSSFLLLGLIFLASPVFVFSGFMYRSAKILPTLGISAIFWLSDHPDRRVRTIAPIFIAFLTVLSDPQGVVMVGILSVAAVICFRFRLGLGLFLAFIFSVLYNHWIAPNIIHHLIGYYPSLDYQTFEFRSVLSRAALLDARKLLYETVGFSFGVNRAWGLILLLVYPLVLSIFSFRNPRQQSRLTLGRPFLLYIMWVSATCLLISGMFVRHPPIKWDDLKRIYYWLPICAVILIGASDLLSKMVLLGAKKWVVNSILLIFLALNLVRLPHHWAAVRNGHMNVRFEELATLKKCLVTDGIREFWSDDKWTAPGEAWCIWYRTRLSSRSPK